MKDVEDWQIPKHCKEPKISIDEVAFFELFGTYVSYFFAEGCCIFFGNKS
jgi:hypothetical protein